MVPFSNFIAPKFCTFFKLPPLLNQGSMYTLHQMGTLFQKTLSEPHLEFLRP